MYVFLWKVTYLFQSFPSLSEASLLLAQPVIYTLLDSVDQNSTEDLRWH